jgi:acetyl esterase
MRNSLLWMMFAVVLAPTACAQLPEYGNRLAKALERYPAADANHDGVLTVDEAKVYKKKLMSQKGEGKEVSAPKGGERHIYKKAGEAELPLYVFKPKGQKPEKPVPAIVFFFGGGWKSGSPDQFQHQCEHFASRGMVAITVEYRVSSRYDVKVEDCIEDAKSAMRWVRENAGKLGVDPDRIASSGGSAGGHLAACTALIDDFNAVSDNQKVSAKPNAMVLFNPVMGSSENERSERKIRGLTHGAIGKILPLTYASEKQAPCIMFFGEDDDLLGGAELFCSKSKKAGTSCEIVTYKDQGHGFFNHGRGGNKHYDLTVTEADQFLVGLGWLKAK